jgi:UDP-2,4-diacetamido-2,4,6-trideoxy-beta-L-altropyranose hydrolase
MDRRRVLLVCDANPQMGTGHVMRQITLATSLKSMGASPLLFCNEIPESLIQRANSFGIDVQHRNLKQYDSELLSEICSLQTSAVVFDGYNFNSATVNAHFETETPTIVLDDTGEFSDVKCHLILNQNLHAKESQYENNSCKPRLLLGLKWSLIRQEIVHEASIHRTRTKETIFIAMGGSDHLGLTQSIVGELLSRNFSTSIAAGFYADRGMTPTEMAIAMATSCALVIGCGTTVWEAMLLGKPFVGVVTAENQIEVAASLALAGICEIVDCRTVADVASIGLAVNRLVESTELYESISQLGPRLIDGKGSYRVAEEILNLSDFLIEN